MARLFLRRTCISRLHPCVPNAIRGYGRRMAPDGMEDAPMYQVSDLNDTKATRAAERARFDSFRDAAACAAVHARQHGNAVVRYRQTGVLLADFRPREGGGVSVRATDAGLSFVEEWAR